MKSSTFILISTLIFALSIGLLWGGIQALDLPISFEVGSIAILVSWITGIVAYFLTARGLHKGFQEFSAFLLMGMFLKMIIGLITVGIVAIKFKEFQTEYVFSYFFSYFAFTSFEVYALMRRLRPNFQTPPNKGIKED